MFTKTVTLAGAELSSFIAGGGMTVNPTSLLSSQSAASVASVAAAAAAARSSTTQAPFFGFGNVPTTTTPAFAFPAATTSTTPSSSARVPLATSSAAVSRPSSAAAAVVESTTATPTTTSAAAAVVDAAPATTAPAQRTTAANVVASTRRTTTSSSGIPAAQVALNAGSAGAKNTASISSGGIAGLIIGLMLLAGIVAAGILYLSRKRKEERRMQDANERSQRERRNEKGAMRLEEENVGNTGAESGARAPGTPGFNFGVLPAIAPAAPMSSSDHYQRSASPADMHRGAAVLGIQRPYTPPPGHPSHPLYMAPASARQGNSRSTTPNSQMSSRNVNYVSGPGMRSDMSQQSGYGQVPRSIVPIVAPLALSGQRSGSNSNSPYGSQQGLVPALQHDTAPIKSDDNREPMTRASGQSFSPGDENLDSFDAVSPRTDSTSNAAALAGASHFERTRSVLQATDGWAQRKAQLKNTIASNSHGASPSTEQSPFADPAPLIHQDISSAPMDIQFGGQNSVSVR